MLFLLVFILVVVCIISLILILTYLVNIPTNDYEKHSSYECGFELFGDARGFFDIHFYTVGLLFIIFDLEIAFLIPYAMDLEHSNSIAFFTFLSFMVILVVGFYYEWALGLLTWVPNKFSPLVKKISFSFSR